jgi:hypothetical protein
MSKTYCIITVAEVTSLPVDFSQVLETSAETLRNSLNGVNTFVKYNGTQPSFLSGKTEYTYENFLTLLSGVEWSFSLGTLDVSGVSTTASLNGTNATQTVSISGSSSTALPVYSWTVLDSDGNATTDVVFSAASAATTDITYNAVGTYTVTMTVTDTNNSDTTITQTISVVVS